MSWLKANWRHVAFALVLLAFVTSALSAAHYRGVAAAERAEAERQTEEIERYRARLAADSVAAAEAEAALAAAREDALRRVSELEAARRAEEATHDSLDAALEAQADSLGGMIPYVEHLERLELADRATARADSVGTLQAERADRAERHIAEVLQPRITELTAQLVRLEARDTVRLRQIAALEGAARARPGISFDLSADWYKVAAGFAVGFILAK